MCAAFVFFNFVLSIGATVFAIKALDEIRAKQREDYNRLTVLSDTLNFEPAVRALTLQLTDLTYGLQSNYQILEAPCRFLPIGHFGRYR